MTEIEKIEKRRAYQREYYKNYRKGKKALEYACNVEQAKKDREKRRKLLQKIACCLLVACLLFAFLALRLTAKMSKGKDYQRGHKSHLTYCLTFSGIGACRKYSSKNFEQKSGGPKSRPKQVKTCFYIVCFLIFFLLRNANRNKKAYDIP